MRPATKFASVLLAIYLAVVASCIWYVFSLAYREIDYCDKHGGVLMRTYLMHEVCITKGAVL